MTLLESNLGPTLTDRKNLEMLDKTSARSATDMMVSRTKLGSKGKESGGLGAFSVSHPILCSLKSAKNC